MTIQCVQSNSNSTNSWPATVDSFIKYQSHYELRIQSRSSILVLIGKTTAGAFACMPDFDAGCHLASLKDQFWNTEKLVAALGKVDGITVATVIFALADEMEL